MLARALGRGIGATEADGRSKAGRMIGELYRELTAVDRKLARSNEKVRVMKQPAASRAQLGATALPPGAAPHCCSHRALPAMSSGRRRRRRTARQGAQGQEGNCHLHVAGGKGGARPHCPRAAPVGSGPRARGAQPVVPQVSTKAGRVSHAHGKDLTSLDLSPSAGARQRACREIDRRPPAAAAADRQSGGASCSVASSFPHGRWRSRLLRFLCLG